MYKLLVKTCFIFLVFCASVYADAPSILPFGQFQEELRYWGNDTECKQVLKDVNFHEYFTSNFVPGQGGSIMVRLVDPNSGIAPIDSLLSKDGDEDRYGFTTYYVPNLPILVNKRNVGLYAIIFNVCMDGQKQSGLVINVTPGKSCVVSTQAWNFCR